MNEEKEKDRSLENGQRGEDAAELLKELGLLAGGADFKSDLQYLPIIGSIEGHSILPQDNKTTKYEHLIPELIAVEENPRIRGLLLILNTVGGDVEAGLALAEMIAGMTKPTATLVLGGGHSIGCFRGLYLCGKISNHDPASDSHERNPDHGGANLRVYEKNTGTGD